MMDVAPVGRGVAAGEHALPIPQLDRPAQLGETSRLVRPWSSGTPSGPSTIRVRVPSQAAQRARAAERMAPKPVAAAPAPVEGSTRLAAGIITSRLNAAGGSRS